MIIKYSIVTYGFGKIGVVYGSKAAAYQATLNGMITKEGWFAWAQSAGAKSIGTTILAKTGLVGGAVASIIKNWKKDNKDPAS